MNDLTATDALKIAGDALARELNDGIEVVIYSDRVQKVGAGWVFEYESLQYLASFDFADKLIGNAPLLVTHDGEVQFLGTAFPVDQALADVPVKGESGPVEWDALDADVLNEYRAALEPLRALAHEYAAVVAADEPGAEWIKPEAGLLRVLVDALADELADRSPATAAALAPELSDTFNHCALALEEQGFEN